MCGGEWFICMWVCGDDRIALGAISQACFFFFHLELVKLSRMACH